MKKDQPAAGGRRKLLVIGNGTIAVDAAGSAYVHNHNAQFLFDLAERGYEVSFASPVEDYCASGSFHNTRVPQGPVDLVLFRKRGRRAPLRAILLLARAIRGCGAVYIFYPGSWPRLAALLCRLLNVSYGLYFRGEHFGNSRLDRWLIRGARFGVAVSPLITDRVRAMNVPADTIRPMSSLQLSDIVPFYQPKAPAGVINLLFVGSLHAGKGIWELLDAVALLRAQNISCHLRVVGSGKQYQELESEISTRGLRQNITLVGLINDQLELMREYEQADIFILPTHSEGFPRVLYEAMAKGLPIVTTMVGGIPGMMKDGVNCLGIPVRNPSAIVDAVKILSENAELSRQLAENALTCVSAALINRPSHLDAFLTYLRSCTPESAVRNTSRR